MSPVEIGLAAIGGVVALELLLLAVATVVEAVEHRRFVREAERADREWLFRRGIRLP